MLKGRIRFRRLLRSSDTNRLPTGRAIRFLSVADAGLLRGSAIRPHLREVVGHAVGVVEPHGHQVEAAQLVERRFHRNLARLRLGIDHRGISHDVLDARVTVVLRDPVTDLVEVDRRLLVAVRVLGHAKQLVLDRGKLIEPDELAVKGAALGEIGYPNPDTDPVVRAVLRTRSDHDLDRETTGIGNQSRAGAVSLVAELRLGKPSGLEALTHLPLVRVSQREEPDARALDAARQVILAVALLPSRQLDLS